MDAELTREWSGQASVPVLQSIRILGEEMVVSATLLQVAGFLGALAALVFAIEVLVEEESRHELLDDLLEGYNQAVIVWAAGQTGATGEPSDPKPLAGQRLAASNLGSRWAAGILAGHVISRTESKKPACSPAATDGRGDSEPVDLATQILSPWLQAEASPDASDILQTLLAVLATS